MRRNDGKKMYTTCPLYVALRSGCVRSPTEIAPDFVEPPGDPASARPRSPIVSPFAPDPSPAMPTRILCLWVVVLLLPSGNVLAQQPAETARARALCDFHGSDGTGKDGPLAKAGFDLLLLYHRTRLLPHSSAIPPSSGLQLRNGYVAIDAIASSTAEQLRSDLDSLGLQDGAQAGRVVSGWFPIDKIPALARRPSLRGVQPARAQTRTDPPAPPSAPFHPPDSTGPAD